MECLNNIHNCSQLCVERDGGFGCDCFDGYELKDDGVTCKGSYIALICSTMIYIILSYIDIDECAKGISGCSQGCRNSDGSFICTCDEGFQTHHEDPTFCVGMGDFAK